MFRALTTGLTLALGVLMVAQPALASVPDPVHRPTWIPTECATGSLTDVRREPAGNVMVIGTAKECGRHVAGSIFAVATFHVRSPGRRPFAELHDARHFRNGQARSFGAATFVGTGTEAVCLMASATKRVACAWVTLPAAGPAQIVPLSTDSPVVARPVELGHVDPGNPQSRAKCATCW